MEESVPRYRTAGPEAMRGQLRHLLAVKPLASVSLGSIPFTAQRTVWPPEAFYVHDDTMAVVETLTAEIKVTQPREVADYAEAFAGLASMAVHGDAARALIQAAIDADATQQRRRCPMNAPTATGPPAPHPKDAAASLRPPSPALLARVDRGYARFLDQGAPDDLTGDHDHTARYR